MFFAIILSSVGHHLSVGLWLSPFLLIPVAVAFSWMSSYFQQVKCIMILFLFPLKLLPLLKKAEKTTSCSFYSFLPIFLPLSATNPGCHFYSIFQVSPVGPSRTCPYSLSFLQLLPPTSLIHFLEMFVFQVNHSWESEDCRALCIGKALSDALRRILSDCRGYLIQVRKYFPFLIISSYGKVVTLHFSLHEIDCSLFQLYCTL